jgi:hypothetical protein
MVLEIVIFVAMPSIPVPLPKWETAVVAEVVGMGGDEWNIALSGSGHDAIQPVVARVRKLFGTTISAI